MQDKWMITLAGMGTVFIALIAIIGMLELFHLIFGTRPEKKRPELAPLPEINSPTVARKTAPSQPAAQRNGAELVAVIAAAIAATTGASPNSFQVTSISASPESEGGFNTPVWGRIERFARK